ncbi:MAG: hypothetical protein ACLFRG_21290, partial [Desulfococcaceae bacterium]
MKCDELKKNSLLKIEKCNYFIELWSLIGLRGATLHVFIITLPRRKQDEKIGNGFSDFMPHAHFISKPICSGIPEGIRPRNQQADP